MGILFHNKYIFKVISLFVLIVAILFINNEIIKYKDIERLSSTIQALSETEKFYLDSANPSQFPIRLGNLRKNKDAYFIVDFKFKGKYAPSYENLFQTAPYNLGVRIEQIGLSIALIISNSKEKEKVSVIPLSNALQEGKFHHIKIEALAREFLRIDFDGEVNLIRTPDIVFSTEEFLIGAGFDSTRNYSSELKNINFKKTNYHSVIGDALRNYPIEISDKLKLIAKCGVFLVLAILFVLKRQRNLFTIELRSLSKTWILVLLIIQALVIYGNSAYRSSLIVYCYLLLIGFYPSMYLKIEYLKLEKYVWLFAPLIGLIILYLTGAYTIAYNYSLKTLLFLPVLSIIIGSLYEYYEIRNGKASAHFRQYGVQFIQEKLFFLTAIVLPISLILTSPASSEGIWDSLVSTPIRVGPDAALYSRMTQFLLDGGTWSIAKLGIPDFMGMRVGEITSYTNATMDWPFLYFYRWGLVTFQYMYVTLSGQDHTYRVAFTSMLIPVLLIGGIIFYWLREKFSLSIIASIAGSIGIIFNVNLLNLWYEGFYGNTYSLCMYAFFYLLVVKAQDWKFNKGDNYFGQYLLISLVLASILVSYGEGLLFVCFPLIGIYFIVDLFIRKKINFKLLAMLLSCLAIAIIIVLPCQFIYDWFIISIKQITEEGGNGYPQPFWAAINEILGINNIYEGINSFNGGNALQRSNAAIIRTLLSSAFVGLILILHFKNDNNKSNSILNISAYALTIFFVIYIYRVSPSNNYGYMKMYIFLLPLLYVYFYKASYGAGKFFRSVGDGYGNHIAVAISAVIFLNGISYIANYNKTSTLISPNLILSHAQLKNLDLNNKVFVPVLKGKFPNILPALFPAKWVTDGWYGWKIEGDRYFENLLDRNIYLFIEKVRCNSKSTVTRNVYYEDNNFIIIDSGKSIRSLLTDGQLNKSNMENISTINTSQECIVEK